LEILDSAPKTVQVAFAGTLIKVLLNFGMVQAGVELALLHHLFLRDKVITPVQEHTPGQLLALLV
jgi:hypothetical protein